MKKSQILFEAAEYLSNILDDRMSQTLRDVINNNELKNDSNRILDRCLELHKAIGWLNYYAKTELENEE